MRSRSWLGGWVAWEYELRLFSSLVYGFVYFSYFGLGCFSLLSISIVIPQSFLCLRLTK